MLYQLKILCLILTYGFVASDTCTYGDEQKGVELPGCTGDSCKQYATLAEAQEACCTMGSACGGVTYSKWAGTSYGYETRAGSTPQASPSNENCWVKQVVPGTADPNIWPLPHNYTYGESELVVSAQLHFKLLTPSTPTIQQAFARYTALIFQHPSDNNTGVQAVSVDIANNDESHPALETDESYTLKVSLDNTAAITANTIYGAMRALETFSQLVTFNHTRETYFIEGAPWSISDAPRFPHRGLMIDTARHFQPLSSIKSIIDSLPYAKLNVLHWHMSDSQSYPMQVHSYPKLWDGSWSKWERYTQRSIATIVEYARLRGVRVIVEFDMPGHAASWCVGYPEICPSPTCTQPLNVANNKTFDVITSLLNEMTGGHKSLQNNPSGLYPDDFIHLGGDEVNTACWNSTPAVAQWLAQHNMTDDDGYAYFVKRVADIAISQGRRPIQWSEVFDHFKGELDKRTVVHIWKKNTNVTEVVALGYNVLLNVGYDTDSWYLDNLNTVWTQVYAEEPCTGVPDNLCPLIIGGHGEMWGETVDASDLEQTVWPRLAAIAERLWSPRDTNNADTAHPRIQYFRCLLNSRGIKAAPVNNAVARSAPPHPGSCYLQ